MMDSTGSTGALGARLAAARPRVVAALLRTFRSIDLAEDGFQEATLRALGRWPEEGSPRDATAWLIRTARNLTIDRLRRERRETELPPELAEWADGGPTSEREADLAEAVDRGEMRDDVLRLLFLCCHDELPPGDQLALALKVVGGFSVDEVARAFLVKPKTMEQRITRAKKKAGAVAGTLGTPTRWQRRQRLDAVSTMVYLMFNEGYSGGGGEEHLRLEMAEEAIRLARLLLDLFPTQPELMGLLALCLLQHSRREARLDERGELVRLEEQDRSRWDSAMIAEGRVLVEKALRKGTPGRYQVQAAIAAVHCCSERAEQTDWREIAFLYAALEQLDPSPVVRLNRAVAIARVEGPMSALARLEPLEEALSEYLYFYSTRASLLAEAGCTEEAITAYRRALDQRPTQAERAFLEAQIDSLSGGRSSRGVAEVSDPGPLVRPRIGGNEATEDSGGDDE